MLKTNFIVLSINLHLKTNIMKLSKCLIFKIKDQRFAVKTQNVIDYIEKVYLIPNQDSEETCHHYCPIKI